MRGEENSLRQDPKLAETTTRARISRLRCEREPAGGFGSFIRLGYARKEGIPTKPGSVAHHGGVRVGDGAMKKGKGRKRHRLVGPGYHPPNGERRALAGLAARWAALTGRCGRREGEGVLGRAGEVCPSPFFFFYFFF